MFLRIATIIDIALASSKWPIAMFSLVLLPGSIISAWQLIGDILFDTFPLIWFSIGFAGYSLGWQFLFKQKLSGSFLSTLEHELTHAFVALATFHPVINIEASWHDGGKVSYIGKGNWLITISPYFLPTASLLLVVIMILAPGWLGIWIEVLLGISVSYHLTSTWTETHSEQPDLQQVGFPFAFMFLPAANIIWYGLVIEFCWDSGLGVMSFAGRTLSNTLELLDLFF